MNLNSLFQKQAELDKYIYSQNNVTAKEVFERKIVALLVELGELANELQFFKYWKENVSIDSQRAIEEYIDVIHFAIGLAVDLGIDEHEYSGMRPRDLNKLFIGIANLATVLSVSKEKEHAKLLIDNVITLGYQLGLNEEIVLSEYNKKNEINYERQKSNY